MKNAISWFEIYTDNFERAKRFYSQVFKCSLTDMPVSSEKHSAMQYALFPGHQDGSGSAGALVHLDVAKPGVGGTLVYFDCQNINEELSRVPAAGGRIIRPKQDTGGFGFIALIEDSEGNMIGLRSAS